MQEVAANFLISFTYLKLSKTALFNFQIFNFQMHVALFSVDVEPKDFIGSFKKCIKEWHGILKMGLKLIPGLD